MASNYPPGVTGFEYQIDPPEPPLPFYASCSNDMRDVVPYGELRMKAEDTEGMTAKELVEWADDLREAMGGSECSFEGEIDTFYPVEASWFWVCPVCGVSQIVEKETNG